MTIIKGGSRVKWVLLLALFITLLIVQACHPKTGSLPQLNETDSRITNNFLEIWRVLSSEWHDRDRLPLSLSQLSSHSVDPNLFVCQSTGHAAGSMTTVEDWTDYIYIPLRNRPTLTRSPSVFGFVLTRVWPLRSV